MSKLKYGGSSAMETFVSTETGVVVSDDTYVDLTNSLKFLGSGVSRDVYVIDATTVLKVNSGGNWAGNCSSEAALWNEVKDTPAERFFAKVYAVSDHGDWLVMERADGTTDYGYARTEFLDQDEFREVQNRYGLSDLHGGNLGVFGSVVKVIDYAMSDHRDGMGSSETCHCERCSHNRQSECSDRECLHHHGNIGCRPGGVCSVCNPRHTCGKRTQHGRIGNVLWTCQASATENRSACKAHRSVSRPVNPFGARQGRFTAIFTSGTHGFLRRRFTALRGMNWTR